MRNSFYPKMALTNIRKNGRMYLPYMIASICTIMMFFMMMTIIDNPGIDSMPGNISLKMMLILGEVIVGVFAVVFLFYTNSFLMKRRKKELGLYSILGLEKRHIGRILFFEVFFTAVFCLAAGILAGSLFSRLMFLILLKMVQTTAPFTIEFSRLAVKVTVTLFGAVFLATLVSDLFQIGRVRPIELLHGDKRGEKEPKARWILAFAGFALLGGGYYIALHVETPVEAIMEFFIATLLVMGGTYLLFTTGSIAVLKMLKKNKKFYYKPRHFTTVSGMLYRMKQNAVGLANICILSTGVLLAVSTTVSLNVGMSDLLKGLFPEDIGVYMVGSEGGIAEKLYSYLEGKAEEADVSFGPMIDFTHVRVYAERSRDDLSEFVSGQQTGDAPNDYAIIMTDLEQYNKVEGKNESLGKDEVIISGNLKAYGEEKFTLDGRSFHVKEEKDSSEIVKRMLVRSQKNYVVVFSDKSIIDELTAGIDQNLIGKEEYMGMDIQGSQESRNKFDTLLINDDFKGFVKQENINQKVYFSVNSGISEGQEMRSFISGFLFIGIFIGVLFLMATALIIYYKQISEGYEDKERYVIMQQVGMSLSEVKKCIHSQILSVFFLPLLIAIVHICVAFNIINKLLWIFGLYNTPLFMLCTAVTILIFAVVYTIVFSLTSRTYVKIVGTE
ncbi:ABC transporter permease [Murimonas intestini]|uniref:ABC transport system permease protein n=1 Tax=Murimonas intestini TaxID=1337051 RepID=A0AB73T4R6_9FIRM|nr:ABC transporter permease [Murimonas intestini]MCR1840530.1 ABC transporter permease [Murimonas intestini]MCR1865416.1 ABC transporter permease [Murimonas intestini]MCR1882873.1 ABC transporter permease [Murimonas intestini]